MTDPTLTALKAAQRKFTTAQKRYLAALEAREDAILAALDAGVTKAVIARTIDMDDSMLSRVAARISAKRSRRIQGEER